ncbi:hypothetical protein [Paenibacillus ginsengarvi]|uniref:Ferric oxidoreductase domain-containing protein n=1 Tax=Paenibacillus ginsengarvi TaxID=400777 RepID=A0A3B0AIR1_9BACL|nr:hypothetical protein [Paenibacillus ginsengarvi]RKN60835.1 hypothetical protein D7M11_35650 [Paenibacillus ginsengarvi]
MIRRNVPNQLRKSAKRTKTVVLITLCFTVVSALSLLLKKGLPHNWTSGMVERFWAHVGSNSMYLSFFAIGLLVVKIVNKNLKTVCSHQRIVMRILKFFAKHHIAVGWAGLALAISHSAYYLILLSPKVIDTYTGILALLGMGAVTWIGRVLQKRANHEKARHFHMYVGIVFIAILLLHDYYAGIHHDMGIYEEHFGK